ncbi:MAG: RDD family protein [Bdellovibrionales bacterium]|nr:RDD family protein [Oligoflexia bacterium]
MIFAGFWVRFAAHIIDFVLLNAVEYGLETLISEGLGLSAVAQQVLGVFLTLGLCYFYYVEIPMRRGTTFGKQVFGIIVIDAKTGGLFTRKQATVRVFSYLFSYAMVGCGFLMAAFHPQKRAFHDLIAGTVSIRRKDWLSVDDSKEERKPEKPVEPALEGAVEGSREGASPLLSSDLA